MERRNSQVESLPGDHSPAHGDSAVPFHNVEIECASLNNSQVLSQKSNNVDGFEKEDEKVFTEYIKTTPEKQKLKELELKKKKLKKSNLTLRQAIERIIETGTESSLNESFSIERYLHPPTPVPKNISRKKQLEWLQEKRNIGLWVFCDNCNKQRWLENVVDPTELPEKWFCHMNPDKNFNDCSIREKGPSIQEEVDMIFNSYNCGSIIWGKVDGYPWWPGMIDDDPDILQYYWLDEFDSQLVTQYHCVFFDSGQVSRCWLTPKYIKAYIGNENLDKGLNYNKTFKIRIEVAKQQAKAALKLNLKERLAQWSFVARWPGRIYTPKPSSDEDTDESSNSEEADKTSNYKRKSKKNRKSALEKSLERLKAINDSITAEDYTQSDTSDMSDNSEKENSTNVKSKTSTTKDIKMIKDNKNKKTKSQRAESKNKILSSKLNKKIQLESKETKIKKPSKATEAIKRKNLSNTNEKKSKRESKSPKENLDHKKLSEPKDQKSNSKDQQELTEGSSKKMSKGKKSSPAQFSTEENQIKQGNLNLQLNSSEDQLITINPQVIEIPMIQKPSEKKTSPIIAANQKLENVNQSVDVEAINNLYLTQYLLEENSNKILTGQIVEKISTTMSLSQNMTDTDPTLLNLDSDTSFIPSVDYEADTSKMSVEAINDLNSSSKKILLDKLQNAFKQKVKTRKEKLHKNEKNSKNKENIKNNEFKPKELGMSKSLTLSQKSLNSSQKSTGSVGKRQGLNLLSSSQNSSCSQEKRHHEINKPKKKTKQVIFNNFGSVKKSGIGLWPIKNPINEKSNPLNEKNSNHSDTESVCSTVSSVRKSLGMTRKIKVNNNQKFSDTESVCSNASSIRKKSLGLTRSNKNHRKPLESSDSENKPEKILKKYKKSDFNGNVNLSKIEITKDSTNDVSKLFTNSDLFHNTIEASNLNIANILQNLEKQQDFLEN